MNYRKLGKTGLDVSEVGFGAWGIGKAMWVGASDDESVKALHRAFDLGLDFVKPRCSFNGDRGHALHPERRTELRVGGRTRTSEEGG